MTDTQLAWAAGFFDGEGYIGFTPCNGQLALRVEVVQADIRPLLKFKEFFGGTIIPKKMRLLNRKPIWRWSVTTGHAAQMLQQLLPWLTVKFEQAELAILSRQCVNRTGKPQPQLRVQREEISRRITELKHASNPSGPVGQNSPPMGKELEIL